MNIVISAVPPGFAPEPIRQDWLGIVLPVITETEKEEVGQTTHFGSSNANGYEVLTSKAIEKLREHGKDEAADFWENIKDQLGLILVFKKECCTEELAKE